MMMKWTPINEKEPIINMHVLLFDKYECTCVGYKTNFNSYDHHPIGDFATGAPLFNVTHWMELPEPPSICVEENLPKNIENV